MRWMQCSRREEDCGYDGCKVLGGRGRLRVRWMQDYSTEEDRKCAGCMDARF